MKFSFYGDADPDLGQRIDLAFDKLDALHQNIIPTLRSWSPAVADTIELCRRAAEKTTSLGNVFYLEWPHSQGSLCEPTRKTWERTRKNEWPSTWPNDWSDASSLPTIYTAEWVDEARAQNGEDQDMASKPTYLQ